MEEKHGTVLRIEKSSIHDGDGLRTVVFLKGCPLRCCWCSTPEAQKGGTDSQYGIRMTAEQVVHEVEKDEVFFFHSGGGVTLSGGEVLSQADFAGEILRKCFESGIHTTIETSLYADFSEIEKLLPYLNDIYIDIKCIDNERHKELTGFGNQLILKNICKIDKSKYPVNIRIRMPIVPGVNDKEEYFTDTAKFLRNLKKVSEIELLPYHRLGVSTYEKLGMEYQLKKVAPPTVQELEIIALILKKEIPEKKVKLSGVEI